MSDVVVRPPVRSLVFAVFFFFCLGAAFFGRTGDAAAAPLGLAGVVACSLLGKVDVDRASVGRETVDRSIGTERLVTSRARCVVAPCMRRRGLPVPRGGESTSAVPSAALGSRLVLDGVPGG